MMNAREGSDYGSACRPRQSVKAACYLLLFSQEATGKAEAEGLVAVAITYQRRSGWVGPRRYKQLTPSLYLAEETPQP